VIRLSRVVTVAEGSGVAAARRSAVAGAEAIRMSETATGKTALVATELATNLVKHGNGGSILIGSDDEAAGATMALVAIDKGAGIEHPDRAMSDGFSTAGSAGQGLGAIRRASALFDLYSLPEKGTAVLAAISEQPSAPAPHRSGITSAGVCIALHGETESGDGWTVTHGDDSVTITLADGLGHGAPAALASNTALRIAREQAALDLGDLLRDMDGALRATRGAAISIARIEPSLRRVDFAGVGNVSGIIVEDHDARRAVSQPGIVGHQLRKVQTFAYPWSASSILILHSDGIGTSWHLDQYPGLASHHPALVAALLYRDYCRGTDDATVVVAKGTS
jgi:anti-sigma regulatory factor (Ser/Thr protein kinase)